MFFKDFITVDLVLSKILLFPDASLVAPRGQQLLRHLSTSTLFGRDNSRDALSCLVDDFGDESGTTFYVKGHIDFPITFHNSLRFILCSVRFIAKKYFYFRGLSSSICWSLLVRNIYYARNS